MAINGKVIQIAIGQVNDDKGYTYPVLYALTSDGQIWTDTVRSKEGHYIPSASYYGCWFSLSAAKPEEFIKSKMDCMEADRKYRETGEI